MDCAPATVDHAATANDSAAATGDYAAATIESTATANESTAATVDHTAAATGSTPAAMDHAATANESATTASAAAAANESTRRAVSIHKQGSGTAGKDAKMDDVGGGVVGEWQGDFRQTIGENAEFPVTAPMDEDRPRRANYYFRGRVGRLFSAA